MVRALGLSAVLALSFASAAFAQGRGTQAEQDACTPDVWRLCAAYIPSEQSIVACLQSNKRNLSQPCYNVFFPRSAMRDLDMTPTGSIGTAKMHGRKSAYLHHQVSASHKRMRSSH